MALERPSPKQFLVILAMTAIIWVCMDQMLPLRRILYVTLSNSAIYSACVSDNSSEYVLYTSTCQIPKFDPFDPSVEGIFIRQSGILNCPGNESFLKLTSSNIIEIDEEILNSTYGLSVNNITCKYKPVITTASDEYDFGKEKDLQLGVPIEDEFLFIKCYKNKKDILHQIIPIVPDKLKLDAKLDTVLNTSGPPEKLNVLIVGIDSISKLNFLRHMPRTYQYIKEELPTAMELNGYNKVGENSFPNLVGLLTGIPGRFYQNFTYFDKADFIWKHYADHGYRTLYTEDMTFVGTFNSYGGKGFKTPPVHYYFRPVSRAMENADEAHGHCYRNKMQAEFYWDYLRTFTKSMQSSKPYFAFTFVSYVVHDEANNAGYMDIPTESLLRYLKDNGMLNNTALFLFSDHGIRYGRIRTTKMGQFEDRMPMSFLIFPEWFLRKYPDVHESLIINQNRLLTLYDIHATFIHFLNFTTTPPTNPRYKNGISLFSTLPENRTCKDAGILPNFCACNLYRQLDVNDTLARKGAAEMVNRINKELEKDQGVCYKLILSEVVDAKINTDPKTQRLVLIVQTQPGDALFESTLEWDKTKSKFLPFDDISRVNMYGNSSWCVQSAVKRKYCYCKQPMPS